MARAKTNFVLPRSDAVPFSVALFQTGILIWMTVEMGLLLLLAASAWFNITLVGYEKPVLLCVGLLSLALFLNNMPSLIARRAGLLCEGIVLLGLGRILCHYLSYETQMMVFPLQDAHFAAWDQVLGFEYREMLAALNHHDIVVKILHRAYYSFNWQIVGTIVALATFGLTKKLNIFLGALLLALIGCCVIGGLLPALGAISVLSADDVAALHWRIDGATPIEHFMRLREGHFDVLNLSQLGGIITFPSFHAATAVIVTHAWRSSYFFIPVCILNMLMALATMTHGGHYLTDTLAGLLLAALCLRLVQMRKAD